MNYFLQTERLGLRNWRSSDVEPMAEINRCPDVMAFFPTTISLDATSAFVRQMQDHFAEHQFCYFAVDRLDTDEMIGFIGLKWQLYESDFTPCVDIGWRLAKQQWGYGFATEGAKACLAMGLGHDKINTIVSVAPEVNTASITVMKKIGMTKVKTFDHPLLADTPRLQSCALYQASAKQD